MAAANTDKFMEVGIAGTATTLSSPGHLIGGTSITVGSTTNWSTNTGVAFAIDRAELVNGVETQIAGTYTEWIGTVASATSITNLTLSAYSPNADQNYSAGSLTRVYIPVTATVQNKMATGIVVEHNQDGTHDEALITSRTADTSPASGDSILTYDTSATALKKVTIANLWANPAYTVSTPPVTGWISGLLPSVSSVTNNGNRSYDITFGSTVASYLTPGMRLRTTRTVAAPTQCTSLNGTTQYYSRASGSVAGMTFTDDFTVSAWVKLSSYPGTQGAIASRYNGTSGWQLDITSSGTVRLVGFNAGAANFSYVSSYQSVPLNRWVHITAQLDMSTFTATTTTSYVMLDGVDIPASVTRGGTNPTALVQAGNLEIGTSNATIFFPGKIAQVATYNAKVTQANIRATISQGLSGSETSLISAYSFNNSINDLNANANNLTANGSAVATNADSPFSQDSTGTVGSYDYAIVTKVATTVATVQVPEGCAIPTSGGVSAVDLSSVKVPYGFPAQLERWQIRTTRKTTDTIATGVSGTMTASTTTLTLPVGAWNLIKSGPVSQNNTVAGFAQFSTRLNGASYGPVYDSVDYQFWSPASVSVLIATVYSKSYVTISAQEVFTHQAAAYAGGGTTTVILRGDLADLNLIAEPAHL